MILTVLIELILYKPGEMLAEDAGLMKGIPRTVVPDDGIFTERHTK